MKFLKLSAFIFLLASIVWIILPHDKLPSISLPKGAQHNTFGELPIVETADDGDFYEVDGDEYIQVWWNFDFDQCYKNNQKITKKRAKKVCSDACREWIEKASRAYNIHSSLGFADNKCSSGQNIEIGGFTNNVYFQ